MLTRSGCILAFSRRIEHNYRHYISGSSGDYGVESPYEPQKETHRFELFWFSRPNFNDSNTTEKLWPWTIISQISVCVTIVTSCVPYLRPLLETLPSGLYRSDELRRRGIDVSYGYGITTEDTHKMQKSPSVGQNNRSANKNTVGQGRFIIDPATGADYNTPQDAWDAGSQHSQSNIVHAIV
ncbi:integral membrane protein [Rutstroemia sp. NJR-2017a BBW]|nr:integral membrane protein [Rutstroemia sp. NJR-2017a BBW]